MNSAPISRFLLWCRLSQAYNGGVQKGFGPDEHEGPVTHTYGALICFRPLAPVDGSQPARNAGETGMSTPRSTLAP